MNKQVLARKPANASAQSRRTSGSPVPSAVHDVVNSPGVPLSRDARAFFEPRFGFDFSRVRVHADSSAATSARSVDAAAYTIGHHIAFDSGKYETHSSQGMQLLGHELAHTVQQHGASQGGELRIGSPTDASEREADRASSSALSNGRAAIHSQRPMSVQRQPNQPALPNLDLDKSLTDSASPMVAAAIGSMTIDQFETGKSDIPVRHKKELARTAKNILNLSNRFIGSKIRVIGNTDAIGKDADNESLGQSRADSVKEALVALGVSPEAIQTESRGASDPVVKTKKENGRNRRVEVQFSPGREFHSMMSSHLDQSGGGGTTDKGDAPPNLLPSHICTVNPEICGGGDQYGPRRQQAPPGATQPLPSNIPWNLMDLSDCNDAYTSHGSPSQIDDPMRATWAKAFMKYRGLGDDKAAKLANSEVCKTLGQDQSRDNPNTQDRFNQEWKNQNPNDKGIPPINPPFKPFQWKF
jgi:outer membrane protein OmpA-like peptidoglycan-associated protein